MQKISDQGRLRPWMGIILFGVLMAFMIFVCAPLQLNLGIPGLIITELGFAAMAVIYCLIRRVKIREVFPVKKIKVREFFGCILLAVGVFPVSLIMVALTAIIFPSSAAEAGELSNFIYGSLNYPLAVLIIALLPAICEEAIHRGAILSNFRGIKRDWVIVLIMGLMFGINHVSVLRFLSTMLLGMVLSYVVVKKNNILLSMLMHFTNNLISLSLGYLSGAGSSSSASASSIDYTSVLGAYLVLGFLSPILITLGLMLIYPEGHKKIRFLIAGIMSVVMLASGIAINVSSVSKSMILNTTFGYLVTAEDKDCSMIDFTVEEDCTATVVVMVTNAKGDYTVRIDGDKGSNIINAPVPQGGLRMLTYNVGLQADHYTITIVPDNNAIGEKPQFQITIN
ncbi:MAG: CPBP family intramembrane metalloprotease [Clostridiales bacterium]|nr:CPBP family intramembrane metalloprotease [Clostridiales bacterium]